jgi:hypothetical protein
VLQELDQQRITLWVEMVELHHLAHSVQQLVVVAEVTLMVLVRQ